MLPATRDKGAAGTTAGVGARRPVDEPVPRRPNPNEEPVPCRFGAAPPKDEPVLCREGGWATGATGAREERVVRLLAGWPGTTTRAGVGIDRCDDAGVDCRGEMGMTVSGPGPGEMTDRCEREERGDTTGGPTEPEA